MQDNEDKSELVRYEEYEDALFRLVMNKITEQEGKIYMEEMEVLKNDPKYIPTLEDIKKFHMMLDRCFKRKQDYCAGNLKSS